MRKRDIFLMGEYELYHQGILGMKWGIRRYRNKDGSLTEEGRKHYAFDKLRSNPDKKWKKMNSNYMTESELDNQLKRLRKEVEFNRLVSDLTRSRREIKGRRFVDTYANSFSQTTGQTSAMDSVNFVKSAGKKIAKILM